MVTRFPELTRIALLNFMSCFVISVVPGHYSATRSSINNLSIYWKFAWLSNSPKVTILDMFWIWLCTFLYARHCIPSAWLSTCSFLLVGAYTKHCSIHLFWWLDQGLYSDFPTVQKNLIVPHWSIAMEEKLHYSRSKLYDLRHTQCAKPALSTAVLSRLKENGILRYRGCHSGSKRHRHRTTVKLPMHTILDANVELSQWFMFVVGTHDPFVINYRLSRIML